MPAQGPSRQYHPRQGRRSLGVVAIGLLAGALVACTAGAPDGSVSDPPDGGGASSAEQVAASMAREAAVGARLTEEGLIPLDLALDLFAGTYAAIDGGDPDAVGPASGSTTQVIRGVLAHWDELTDAQRAAVAAAVGPAADDTAQESADASGTVGVTLAAGPGAAAPSVLAAANGRQPTAVLPDITADIAKLRADLEEHFGRTLSVPIVWVQRPLPASLRGDADSGDAAAGTMPVRGGALAATGRMDTCRIEIYPGGAVEYAGDLAFFQGLLGHEVTHCFQLDAMPDVAQSFRVPEWIIEGSAEYAGAVVTGGTYAQSAWNSWLGEPNLSLFRRAYSAIGAFATAEQSGADPWTAIFEMLTAPSSRAALEMLFDAAPEEAMRTIATAAVREPSLGSGWESTGPGIPALRGTVVLAAGEGSPAVQTVRLQRYATTPFAVTVTGVVVDVTVEGALGRLAVPGGAVAEIDTGFMQRYCVTGSCTCPDGTDVQGTQIPSAGVFGLGLTSVDPVDASFRFDVRSLADACANLPAAEVLVVTFHTPAEFEIHGGHCVLDAGDLIVDASGDYLPDGYIPPPAHDPGASLTLYKNPTSPPTHGTAGYSIGGVEHWGSSTIVIAPDLLSGTFAFDDGAAGEWRCARIETPEEALAGS